MTGTIREERRLGDDGEWVVTPVYLIDGRAVSPDVFRESFPDQLILPGQPPAGPSLTGWPMVSEAMAVHPKQLELARKLDRDRGAPPTEYTPKGQPIFTSERHKRAFIKAHGVHDNNSYGG